MSFLSSPAMETSRLASLTCRRFGFTCSQLKCENQEALKGEGDMRPSGDGEPMGSLLIYPGCKVIIVAMIIRIKMVMLTKSSLSQIYLFEEPNFEGEFVEYTGPAVMPDPKYLFGVSSFLYLWTLATEHRLYL